MFSDALEIDNFYRTVTGGLARRVIMENIYQIWDMGQKRTIFGAGFTDPFLNILREQNDKCYAFHSVYSGLCVPPQRKQIHTCLINEAKFPLSDKSAQHILCAHLLESTAAPDMFLKEINRILAPDGDIIFIVPNRRGLWARFEHTPFGSGTPYGRKQLIKLLQKHNLFVTDYYPALFFPPHNTPPTRLYVNMAEYFGKKTFLWRYGGVHIMRAIKHTYIPPFEKKLSTQIKIFPQSLPV